MLQGAKQPVHLNSGLALLKLFEAGDRQALAESEATRELKAEARAAREAGRVDESYLDEGEAEMKLRGEEEAEALAETSGESTKGLSVALRALHEAEAALGLAPKSFKALSLKGRALMALARYAEAKEALQQAAGTQGVSASDQAAVKRLLRANQAAEKTARKVEEGLWRGKLGGPAPAKIAPEESAAATGADTETSGIFPALPWEPSRLKVLSWVGIFVLLIFLCAGLVATIHRRERGDSTPPAPRAEENDFKEISGGEF